MIGILVILSISWALLFFIEGKNLEVLGVLPSAKRLSQLLAGFLITGTLCALAKLSEVWLEGSRWVVNPLVTATEITSAFWWDFKSVLTEELIYRGALLYILISRAGHKLGILVSASAFGIYHWFSFGVFGNIVPMILIFVGTGLMGYAWALSFHKTKSIMLGLGLHLGWNFVHNSIFSKGPLGDLLFLKEGAQIVGDLAGLFNFVFPMLIIPLIILLIVKYGIGKNLAFET